MRILGIDPGTAIVGWGIIDIHHGAVSVVDYGAITTKAGTEHAVRLWEISEDLKHLVTTFKPDEVAIEELFFANNQKTVMAVAESRGAMLLTFKQLGVIVYEYTPLQVKAAVAGHGRADKKDVQYMVTRLLALAEVPKPDDVADALAIALCHESRRKFEIAQKKS